MKTTYMALFFVLCINVGVLIIENTVSPTTIITTMNSTQAQSAYNASEVVETWVWTSGQGLYGDVQAGLMFLWNTAKTLVLGFPDLISSMGSTSILTTGLYAIWGFIWVIFIIEVISGRDITGG